MLPRKHERQTTLPEVVKALQSKLCPPKMILKIVLRSNLKGLQMGCQVKRHNRGHTKHILSRSDVKAGKYLYKRYCVLYSFDFKIDYCICWK